VGASQMLGRSVRQQNLVALLQMMSANPALMQLVNWSNFARQAFELFDFHNVEDLLVQQQQGLPLVNQMAQQNGQSPQSVASATSSTLEQLDPRVLGALISGQHSAPIPGLS
jgi:hypothetical protein